MGKRAAFLALCLAAALAVGAWQYAERLRVIEGTWLYMFEGSEFFEKRLAGHECDLYRDRAAWLHYDLKRVYPEYSYKRPFPSSGTYRSPHGEWRLEAFEIRFEGRRRFAPLGAGHLGGWTSEYDVERMLSVKPIAGLKCHVL
jgi:hypothetical protein